MRTTRVSAILSNLEKKEKEKERERERERERKMVEKILIEGRKRNKSQSSEGTPKTKKEVNRGRHTKRERERKLRKVGCRSRVPII